MALRSPVRADAPFELPFSVVITPSPIINESLPQEDADSSRAYVRPEPAILSNTGPRAVINRFIDLGSSREAVGIRHVLFFQKRPVSKSFTVQGTFRVTGYLSYSYLLSGSVVVGVIFISESSLTRVHDSKLVVCASATPGHFVPSFNLEKMGLLLFSAEDSSVLVTPTDIESNLIVKVD